MYKVVVAKYKENVSWVKHFDPENVVIYDKSFKPNTVAVRKFTLPPYSVNYIPNVGREGETFLRYIVDNYDRLPDYVVFCQGNPFEHIATGAQNGPILKYLISNHIATRPKDTINLFCTSHVEPVDKYSGLRMKEYFKLIFDLDVSEYKFAAGAQYIVPKERILDRPKELYQTLHRMICNSASIASSDFAHCCAPFDTNILSAWTLERLFYTLFSCVSE